MIDPAATPSSTAGADRHAEGIERLAEVIRTKSRIVALTGAGISTASGIPDYRGPGGVWATAKPPTIGDFLESEATRREYWKRRADRYPQLLAASPNRAHAALVRLEATGRLQAIITQNIDGLHQAAGTRSERVIELHGSAHLVGCVSCGATWSGAEIQRRLEAGDLYPSCSECGGILRTATVLFGEQLPVAALAQSIEFARTCDLMLVIGSSLIVSPASKLPLIARRNGATVAIINRTETMRDSLADIQITGSAGDVLPLVVPLN